MPALFKDPCPPRHPSSPEEPNLYYCPSNGDYYARKYVGELKREKIKRLWERDRSKAIIKKNLLIAQWTGKHGEHDIRFDEAALELLEIKKSKSYATFIDYEGTLRNHLLPYFTGKSLKRCLEEWERYKAYQRSLNPKRKLRVDRKHLVAISRYAYNRGLIQYIPPLALEPYDRSVCASQEWTDEEFKAFLENANPKLRLKAELMMETGWRANELRVARWDWVDWSHGFIRIPAEQEKRRREKVAAISDELLQKLRARRQAFEPQYIFPHRDNPSSPEYRTDKGWQRLKNALGLRKKRHWIRATVATRAIRHGVPEKLIQAVLGMSPQVMSRVYLTASKEDSKRISDAVRSSFGKRIDTTRSEMSGEGKKHE